ncbi:MAG: hypothetical protein WBD46_12985 [Acidobacteriaceae bacterium]
MFRTTILGPSLLGMTVIAATLFYNSSPTIEVAGAPYLAAAVLLTTVALGQVIQVRNVRPDSDKLRWHIFGRRPISIFPLAGWLATITGLSRMWITARDNGLPIGILSFAAAVTSVYVCYRIAALTDSPDQVGGYIPISYFGRPRSRRLFVAAFGYMISPIFFASIVLVIQSASIPMALRPPEICLLISSLSNWMAATVAYQRYRRGANNPVVAWWIASATVGFVGCISLVDLEIIHAELYVYTLSVLTALGIGVTTYWLLQGKEEHLAAGIVRSAGQNA